MKKSHIIAVLLVAIMVTAALLVACSPEVPAPTAGQDTIVSGVTKTPDKVDAKTAVFAALGKLDAAESYISEGSGKTVAEKGYITYTQKSQGTTIKHGDEFYTKSVSNSTFVNVMHEAFMKGENVATRKDGGEIVNATAENYKSVYGVTPAKLLSGHVYNQDTILHAEFVEQKDGEYVFNLILDKTSANSLLSYQMKMFGGLNGYPSFTENTTATLVIDEKYTPIKLSYVSKYAISIAVLGELDCVEDNETVFSGFGKDNAIPDTDKFNAAMNSTPTILEPSKDEEISREAQAVVDALLGTDIKNGVSLSGIASIGEYQLPLKINAKADVDGILGGKNIFESLEAKFALNIGKEISVTYLAGNFYVNAAGNKYVFSSDLTERDADLTSFTGNEFIVTQNTDRPNTYTVKLSTQYNDDVYTALKSVGLITCSKREFDLRADIYVPNGNLGTIEILIDAGDKHASIALAVADEYYPTLENVSDYKTELPFGFTANLTTSFGDTADVEFVASYATTELNPLKALHAEAKITLGEVKSLLGMAPMMGMELPDWLSAIADNDFAKVILSEQKLYLAVFKANGDKNDVTYFAEIADIAEIVNTPQTQSISPQIISLILSQLPNYVQSDFDGGELEVTLTDATLAIINDVIASHVIEDALMDAIGNFGGLVTSMLGLDKPVENVYLTLSLLTKSLSIEVKSYDVSSGDVYVPDKEYDVVSVLKLTLTPITPDENYKFENVRSIAANKAAAVKVEQAIDQLLAGYELTDAYKQQINKISASYERLTDEQKLLVSNALVNTGNVFMAKWEFVGDVLMERVNTEIAAVDSFATAASADELDLTKLNKAYDAFNEAQLKLLSSKYSEQLNKYLSARNDSETEQRTALIAAINELDTAKDLSAMSEEDLLAYIQKLDGIYSQYAALLANLIPAEAQSKLFAECNRAVSAYCAKVTITAEELLEKLTDETAYSAMTVAQALELYEQTAEFSEDHDLSDLKMNEILTTVPESYATVIYKVSYYAQYSGKAFKKFAAGVAQREIAAIIGGQYTEEQLTGGVLNNLDNLLTMVDKNAVTNYNEYGDYLKGRSEKA